MNCFILAERTMIGFDLTIMYSGKSQTAGVIVTNMGTYVVQYLNFCYHFELLSFVESMRLRDCDIMT